ncbi:hypothetical protein Bbelb_371860 [Branchiostoma belcheri]|nr:hypothetical protein Bbelb_371860 [Branchiostoma belcheri]
MAEPRSRLPPSFDGTAADDFQLWIQQFDVWADAQQLDQAARLRHFPTYLTGPAFGFYTELPAATKADLALIRAAMVGPFGRTALLEEFRRAANARPRRPNESLSVYAAEIQRLVRLAYPTYNDAGRAGVALDRFLAGLDPDLRHRVMEFGPADVDAAIRQASICEQARHAAARDLQFPTADHTAARITSTRAPTPDLTATVATLASKLTEIVDLLHAQASNQRQPEHQQHSRRDDRDQPPNRRGSDRRDDPAPRSETRRRLPRRPVRPDEQCHQCHGHTSNTVRSVNGEKLHIVGTIRALVHLGPTSVLETFHVLRHATNNIILGWQFCHSHDVTINLASGTVKIKSTTLPLLPRSPLAPRVSDVTVCRTMILPANSVCTVPVRLSTTRGGVPHHFDGVFEPQLHRVTYDGVAAARTVSHVEDGRAVVQIMNTNNHPVRLPEKCNVGRFHAASTPDSDYHIQEAADPATAVPTVQKKKVRVPKTSLPVVDLSDIDLPQPQLTRLSDLIEANRDCFSTSATDIGRTTLVEHRIDTGDAKPIRQQPYRTPVHRRDALREQLSSMLEQDVIEPSTSPWASPVVIVTKKDGTPRFCVDFRKLNSVTVPDAHPLPRIDDTIDALAGSYYFSTLDMKSAYWQVPVHPADRHKTAFCTAEGLWQFKVLPFGLSNSAATYQRLVQLILAGVGWDVCLAYLDDIIVFTPTFDEHLHTLQEVFTRLRQAGLKLHPAKCRFAQKEVTFLGHVVSRRGVAPDPDNIAKVQDWPTPSNQTDIRSFLGLASFYRKFVPAFATVAEPLVRLTDKHHTFQWNPACQSAFDTLKHQLTNPPLLAFPDFASDFTLATDASTSGIGAVLTQTHGGTQRVVAYASKTLSRTQRRWSTYDREFWAAVWAIRHFRPYLYGRNFILTTDHRPLLSCRDTPLGDGMAQGRRTRWAIELSTYQFTIKYRPGPTNTDADALSRRPPSPPPDNVDAALDTPDSAEVVVRDTAEPAEVISADDSTEPKLLHDVVRDEHDSANVVSADDQPAPVPASSPEVVRDDRDSATVIAADDPSAPVPASPPDVVRDTRLCHSHQHPLQEAICSAAQLATAPAIDFRAAQQADATIREVRQWLQDPAGRPPALAVRGKHRDLTLFWSDFDSLFLSDDLLYRRPVNSPPSVKPQLVIPRELACHVLPALHDDSTAGHFGPSRTLHRARERFYWLGMTMDVARHCRECVPCQQRRQPVPSLRAPFQHITADRPFQVVATDITYMPLSSAGNKYVLVVSDVFTKYVNLYPIPKQDAATVADKLFRDFVGQHGVPDQIHSDQGSQFESQLVAELCARLQISKTRTSPYHPQGDGQVERFNRTMKNILAKALAGREHDWDLLLPHVALAYNTSVHSTTKFTPYFLVHGREARLPVDIACQLPATTTQLADLNAALTSVRQAIAQSHQTQDQYNTPHVRRHHYQVDDRVWLHHPPTAQHKLRLPWTGPFVITATLPADSPTPILYRIRPETGNQRLQVVHHNRLKPYIAPTRRRLPAPPDAPRPGYADFIQQYHFDPPAPVLAQPAPVPVPAQPAPVPVPAQPAPVPVPAQPAPAPVPAQPAPVPVPAQPAPVPVPAQPAPVPVPAQPAPPPPPAPPPAAPVQPAQRPHIIRTRSGRISRPPDRFMDFDYG